MIWKNEEKSYHENDIYLPFPGAIHEIYRQKKRT